MSVFKLNKTNLYTDGNFSTASANNETLILKWGSSINRSLHFGQINNSAGLTGVTSPLYIAGGRYNTGTLVDTDIPLFLNPFGGTVGIGGGDVRTAGNTFVISQTTATSGALKGIVYTGKLNTNQTTSIEIPAVTFTTVGRQWTGGAIPIQREVLITQPTYSFTGLSTIINAATLGIVGAPITNTNAILTNTHGILVSAGAVNGAGTAAASYGLTVNTQSGATTNYAAAFLGGNVGIGTPTPDANAILDVSSTTKAFMPPRMSTVSRNAISPATEGMMVYDTTLHKLYIRTVSTWEAITSV